MKNKQKEYLIFFSFCLLAVLFFFGCQETVKKDELEVCSKVPVEGGIYERAFPTQVLTLDPRDIGDSFSHEVSRQIFDGLVEFKVGEKGGFEKALVTPSLAKSWKVSDDRLTYVFEIRDGVKFHAFTGPDKIPTKNGGRLVVAEDVRFTFNRLLSPTSKTKRAQEFLVIKGAKDYNDGHATEIEGIKVVASNTISFTLEKPFAPFLSLLALCNAFIVPREDVEALGENFARNPVGTGPFYYVECSGEKIVLKANPTYFMGKPYLEGIEFPIMRGEMDVFNAFMRGELSQSNVPDPEYKNIVTDPFWSKYFQESSRWGTFYLCFNVTIPPFDNVKVRQAFNYAIDRETIVNLILNGRARIAKGVLPPGIMNLGSETSHSGQRTPEGVQVYTYDLVKAKKLMAEAGYPDGKGFPDIVLQFNRDPSHTRTSEFILANLRDLGITCKLQEVEFREHLQGVEAGKVGFFRMGWTADYPDPDNFLYTLFHSTNIGAQGNFGHYSNPMVDELLEKARFEIDPTVRIPLYNQIEQIIVNDAPWVFIYHYTTHVLVQPYVRNLELTPLGAPFILYRQIWIDPLTQKRVVEKKQK
ncbi:MAG: ABC transporter substrate-binding protein [Candidatus Riflebacteria bacterium]|nr:ABC transporter substrate-binding protein [Candidatus Riflebacteria bacterium]